MSLILDALRKAKSLAGGSAPQRAPAFLKSFGFEGDKPEPKKSKKILHDLCAPDCNYLDCPGKRRNRLHPMDGYVFDGGTGPVTRNRQPAPTWQR